MHVDDTRLRDLLEQSQDLHADAMRASESELDELVELGHEHRTNDDADAASSRPRPDVLLENLPRAGVLAGAGLGAAMVALIASPAFADTTMDVQMLQTAASLENLAVAAYTTALTLDFIGGGAANPVVKAFVETTKAQHEDHAKAFNAATTRLGGKAQNDPTPSLLQVVNTAAPTLTDAAKVVDLALELENTAAATYVADVGRFRNKNGRSVTASIMGVEAQHAAILNAVKALLAADAAQLIALPPDAAALPAAAGSVGFPDAFFPTQSAVAATEGAVK